MAGDAAAIEDGRDVTRERRLVSGGLGPRDRWPNGEGNGHGEGADPPSPDSNGAHHPARASDIAVSVRCRAARVNGMRAKK
jgi:hypothetical protein